MALTGKDASRKLLEAEIWGEVWAGAVYLANNYEVGEKTL
jgi:hypothetical protein